MLSETVFINSIVSDIINNIDEGTFEKSNKIASIASSSESECSQCDSDYCKCPCVSKKRSIKQLPNVDKRNSYGDKRRKFFSLAQLIYTVDKQTTDMELDKVLKGDVRILHVQMAYCTKDELHLIMLKITTAISKFHMEANIEVPIALAVEINGRVVRTGRLRNDQTIKLVENNQIILTCNLDYRNCSSGDVVFVKNFHNYIQLLKIGDYIFINHHKIQLVIIKITRLMFVTCCILRGSYIKSYSNVTLPYHIAIGKNDPATLSEIEDCQWAIENNADFIILPSVTDANYINCINTAISNTNIHLNRNYKSKLLINIDTCYLRDKSLLLSVLKSIDGIWIDHYLHEKHTTIMLSDEEKYIIETARKLKIPVIVKMPKIFVKYITKNKTICSYTKKLLLYEPDCFIVKRNYSKAYVKLINTFCHRTQQQTLNNLNGNTEKTSAVDDDKLIIPDCAVKTATMLSSTLCVCLAGDQGENAIYLSYLRPLCPIVCITTDTYLARQLTIWKNVLPIVYDKNNNDKCWRKNIENHLERGIKYAHDLKLIFKGDLIVFGFNALAKHYQSDMNSVRLIYIE